METFDAQRAAAVWQRVRGGQTEIPAQQLLDLIAGEMTAATTYLALSRRLSGRDSSTLHRLFEQAQGHAACLRGICTLITGERPVTRAVPPESAAPGLILRKAYGREMQALAAYESYAGHPEYGAVFARLAEQSRERCRMVLEIIGNQK